METVIDSEKERIDLLKKLGCFASADFERETVVMQNFNAEWIEFKNCGKLQDYLIEKFKLFGINFLGIKLRSLFFEDHIHRLSSYRQRIPMSALMKLKAAKESGVFIEFAIVDPDIKSEKVDPFLIGFRSREFPGTGFSSVDMNDSPTLIAWWLNKKEK